MRSVAAQFAFGRRVERAQNDDDEPGFTAARLSYENGISPG
jgi:hypothetical protein